MFNPLQLRIWMYCSFFNVFSVLNGKFGKFEVFRDNQLK